MSTTSTRSRWATLGAALAMVLGAGGVLTSSAAPGGTVSSFVPITPCRLFDTRPGSDNVGARSTPVAAGEVLTVQARGPSGLCNLPSDATGVALNVAIVNPTAASFLTVYPADATRPLAANLNWVAGQEPTPNAVTAALAGDGRLAFYNLAGSVDLAVDVDGYYVPSTAGPAGPQGPAGPAGPSNPITDEQIGQLRWDQDPTRNARLALVGSLNGAAFDGEHLWVAAYTVGAVHEIDPVTATVIRSVPVSGNPMGVAYDGSAIWVTRYSQSRVSKIDPASATIVATVDVGANPLAITYDGRSLWVSCVTANALAKIDPVANMLIGSVPLGASPRAMAFDGTALWVARYDANDIVRVDTTTNALGTTVAIAGHPYGMAFDGLDLWVSALTANAVARVSVATATVLTTIPTGSAPISVAFDGRYIWTANNTAAGTLSRIDITTNQPAAVALIGGGGVPYWVGFDGSNIWVTASTMLYKLHRD